MCERSNSDDALLDLLDEECDASPGLESCAKRDSSSGERFSCITSEVTNVSSCERNHFSVGEHRSESHCRPGSQLEMLAPLC